MLQVTADHGQGAKGTLMEHGLRVPLFVRYPPLFKKGSTVDTMVSTVDHVATWLELAEADSKLGHGVSWIGKGAQFQPS